MKTNQRQSIIIRADSSSQMGIGHVMRSFALAQAWQLEGGRVIFLSQCESESLRHRIVDSGMEFIPLSNPFPDPRDIQLTLEILRINSVDAIRNQTWLVLDGYQFDSVYQGMVREAGFRLLVIDDMAHLPTYHTDILLNQNLGAEKLIYNCDSNTVLLLGSQYVLLRQEFLAWRGWKREIPDAARKILITMGGSDPDNVTLKVLQAFEQIHMDDLDVVIIVGGINPHYEVLQSAIYNLQIKISLVRDISNMPELMSWADVAIAAGGSTCWELVFMGVPSLVMALAENQLGVVNQLEALGLAVNLGWHQQVTSSQMAKSLAQMLASPEMRKTIAHQCHAQVDGDGVDRILMQIHDNGIRLRRVREGDKLLLWEWANVPEVRAASFSTDIISWEQHLQWFDSKQKDPNCVFYLALNQDDVPLGQVRFDVDDTEATISISLDEKYRGNGYGSQLITLAIQKLYLTSQVQIVHAYIKDENWASVRAFLKAKFLEDEITFIQDQRARHLILDRKRII